MIWFVQERTHDGGWTPKLYHGDEPTQKRTDHRVQFREAPVQVPDYLQGQSLDLIAEVLAPDGALHNEPAPKVREFIQSEGPVTQTVAIGDA